MSDKRHRFRTQKDRRVAAVKHATHEIERETAEPQLRIVRTRLHGGDCAIVKRY
ncbi:MAG: hypothetical protein ACKVP5_10675 [Aestuariivirga sp.]